MANDTLNGAKIIIDEMKEELTANKRLSRQDKMYLKSSIYQLTLLSNLRGDVEVLKKHDVFSWAVTYPKLFTIGVLLMIILGGLIDWGIIRKPLMQGVLKLIFGIDIPLQ